ncbi:very-short-patch-repair endonuclease [Actinopolyspora biskrensis]|uniref:Very-short-patch-repair endonuclease n=1 Tax=Actinopolyspora biskrensis TaxID=1470178 RepID=A0A852YX00_9ACTN|nr:DUF559 domain-containing protein [Actinopolyspora biskrensis]NYH78550.1 very-short-patch-repair endonuclease [Actinopolyspora biskrensis]
MQRKIAEPEFSGLFTRVQALRSGLTDSDLKATHYRRVLHGVYRTSTTPPTHLLRCSAAALRLPARAVITGRSAATLYGVPLARASDPVEVIVSGCKRAHGIRSWNVRCYEFEKVEWAGVHVARIERACFDMLARNSVATGVACCDAVLRAGELTPSALAAYLEGRSDDGVVRARRAVRLLDARAESVPESVLRVFLVLAGIRPTPQLKVVDADGRTVRVDLGFEEARLAVEYDGAWHGEPGQFHRDQRRLAALRANGWYVMVVTAEELTRRPRELVQRVRTKLHERSPSFA